MKRALCILLGASALLASACGARVTLGELPSDSAFGDDRSPTLPADGAPTEAGTAEGGVGAADAGSAPYVSCAGKVCGQACSLCAPGDSTCFETAEQKQCDVDGTCKAQPPSCAIDGGVAPYVPCAGKACGATCTICAPSDFNCFEPAVVKQCNVAGTCTPSPPGC